jgi:type IV pilus assembly protein PilB
VAQSAGPVPERPSEVRPVPPIRAALGLLRRAGEIPLSSLWAAGFQSIEEAARLVADQLKLARLELDGVELSRALTDLVPEQLARRKLIIPIFATGDELTVATCDPTQIELLDWLGREIDRQIVTVVATYPEIDRAIHLLYDGPITRSATVTEAAPSEVTQEDLLQAKRVVDRLILEAVQSQASDIHVEAGPKEMVVRFRLDGFLRQVETRPIEEHAAIVSRIKVMAELDIAEHQIPQDGRIKVKRPEREIDLRVSVLPTIFGEKVCCRILDNTRACLPLADLGFEPEELEAFDRLIRIPYGLLLVTGPTGSGKSTTLYGALNAVRTPEVNIVTVEDPVEYQLPGINQVQVNPKRGLTFAGALRSILRQDPNIILVGEIRDRETGMIASEAALTGHLVMTSLHTNDSASAITRLTEMGIEPFLVAPALIGVIAQRLIRKVCPGCADNYAPPAAELKVLGIPGLPAGTSFRRGRGCGDCHGSGYKGRTAVREILEASDVLKERIVKGAGADELRTVAIQAGFRTMRHQALRKLFAGITTSQEVIRLTR